MEHRIGLIHGDGIGPEIVDEAKKVLDAVCTKYGHTFVYSKLLFARFIISIALIRKKIPSGSNLIHKGVSSIVSLSDA